MSVRLPTFSSAAVIALVLTAAPVALRVDAGGVSFSNAASAQGRGNDGEDRGRGNDEDRGRGNDERGGGNAADRANDNAGNPGRGPGANAGPGNNNDPKFAAAEERVRDAAAQGRRGRDLTNDDIDALIAGGWGNRPVTNDGFRNHGERVRTYVAIAKALGEGAYVGALQANFGPVTATTPPPANPRPPGARPPGDWATVNLDVNKDGIIDARDLLAAEAAPRPPATTTAPRTN